MLRSRLYEMELAKQHDAEQGSQKKPDRNRRSFRKDPYLQFPQGRVTDHRIKLTLHRLDAVLGGDLDEILTA